MHLAAMSVIMEQQGTSTSTVTNTQIPGIPSDASALNSLRNVFRRNETQKRPRSTRTTELRGTGDVPTLTAISSAETRSKSPDAKKSTSAAAQSKSPTIERQANVAPAEMSATQSKADTQPSLSIPNGIGAHPVPDLITKNHRIRRILERVNWTKLRGDSVEEVATFRELEDAETKFQEFESFIRAEGKYLGLPEGCKPFERVLIQGSMAGSKPCPYIRFTNFRTEEDVRRYHAALSKRKVKHQYHPPLRLCYEIQRLKYHAANAGVHFEGDPDKTLCGKTAMIEDAGTRRLITIGGVIQVDKKLYAMTAGHAATAADELKNTSETESSFGPYSDDAEYDDDVESALICGGPGTNSDAGWQPHRDSHNDEHQNTSESAALTFHGSSMSGDDWSLHLIEDPLLALPNALPEMDSVTTRYMTYPASQPFPGLVCLIAGVSGPVVIPMLPGVHGDSGSWVVDCTNGNVFGHVIASTDTTAFLIPLIHTLDSISRQAKLKGAEGIISLPPAFDMLADLAHKQSPASEVAPIIDSFLKSYGNSSTIRTIVQNLLVRTGADLKGNLASIYRDENSESLSKVIEDSAPIEKEVTKAAIRDLAIALGNHPESFGVHEIPWERRLLLLGGENPEPKEQSSQNEPSSQSRLVHNMPGVSRHSKYDVIIRSDNPIDVMTKAVPPILGSPKLEQHEKHLPVLRKATNPPSSTLYDTHLQMRSQSPQPTAAHLPKSRKKRLCGMSALACAGLSIIIAALIAAISILGAFLGLPDYGHYVDMFNNRDCEHNGCHEHNSSHEHYDKYN
ncbi:hypothetical protein J7T55_002449 [Diaporthe amygdali]|uniref:uncharacterized protein n=1 Tax=Phomopsis amygdali TaxID=1214568 RepID=UPI0022FEF92E|nr:uncharacterized protein J7T55_002449 [Diaporthe amygdali]KAJ0121939.1 hypothetical protein J7T55_002449 [Diaporthe amygdali]